MRQPRWRVHIVTMTSDQGAYDAELRRWLRQQGHTILAEASAAHERKLAAALAADLCLVLLGAHHGTWVPASSFSEAELEVSAAQDRDPGKVLVFAQPEVATPDSPEQDEFIQRLRSFAGGTFQATCASPAEFIQQVRAAMGAWQPLDERAAALRAAPRTAVMISSTGDLLAERQAMRGVLLRQRLPVIDYLSAASEALPPVERVTRWASESRALFLILGTRYGYVSPIDGLGVTELEFVTALRAGRPIVAFVRADAATTDDRDQQQFVARVRRFVPADQLIPFADAAELVRLVPAQIARLPRLRPAPTVAIAAGEARAWHRRHLRRWLARLPVPGRPETLPLDDMPLLLTPTEPDPLAIPKRQWLGELWTPEFPLDIPTDTADEAAAAAPRMLLLGGPGTGKSTVLRWYARAASDDVTPIYLALPRYAQARAGGAVATLREYIRDEEARLLLAPAGDRSLWLEDLDAGRAILLLDAFDGVPPERQPDIAAEVAACAASLPAVAGVVVAARSGGEAFFDPAAFTRYYMAPLNLGQQQILIAHWTAARFGATLGAEEQRKRVVRLLFQLRVMRELADWARSPLLLGLYTAVNDQGEDKTILAPLTATGIYRRVLRAQLAQGEAPHRIGEREALLLALARQALTTPPEGNLIAGAEIAAAWRSIPGTAADTATESATESTALEEVVDALVARNGLLVRQANGYSLLSPSFWSYLTARALAVAPTGQRLNYVARRRLADSESDLIAALVGELDWYSRHANADQIIQHLLACDEASLTGAGPRDPYHLALSMASSAQGVRPEPYLREEPGPTIARTWERIWRAGEYGMRQTTVWNLFVLGPAAALACDCVLEALRDDPKDFGVKSGYIYSGMLVNRLASFDIPWAVAERERLTAAEPPNDPDAAVVAKFDATLEELAARLDHPNPKVRMLAATNLRKFGLLAAGCVPQLIPMLADEDPSVATAAAGALRGMNVAAAPALEPLVSLALREPDMFDGGNAYYAVRNLGALAVPCLPRLEAALRGDDATAKRYAIHLSEWLGHIAQPLSGTLLEIALEDGDRRYSALRALRATGASVLPLVAAARARLADADEKRRRDGLDLVTYLRADGAPLLPELLEALADGEGFFRSLVMQAIGALGAEAAPALEALRALLRDPDVFQRRQAVESLGELGPAAWPALGDLYACLRDGEWMVRQRAVEALQKLDPPRTPELHQALIACLADGQKLVSDAAFDALCELRPLTPAVLDHLLVFLAAYPEDERISHHSRLYRALRTVADATIPTALVMREAAADSHATAALPSPSVTSRPQPAARRWPWLRARPSRPPQAAGQ